MSKQDRKERRRKEQAAKRLDTLADVGDFGELAEVSEALIGTASASGLVGDGNEQAAGAVEAATTAALQRAVNVFAQAAKKQKKARTYVHPSMHRGMHASVYLVVFPLYPSHVIYPP